jgi:mono/diheme cytochrome c family protein
MPRRTRLALLAVLAVLALVGVASGVLFRSDDRPKADPDNPVQVARGRQVYARYCASCHGDHLQGQPDWRHRRPDGRNPAPPHDYHGHTWRHPDAELFGMVKRGFAAYAPPGYKTDMIGFGDVLSDADIWAVLAFIKSDWPPEFQAYQAKLGQGPKPPTR